MVSKIWEESKKAWLARGGKKNLKMSYVPQNFFAPLDMPITVKRFLKGLDFAKKKFVLLK